MSTPEPGEEPAGELIAFPRLQGLEDSWFTTEPHLHSFGDVAPDAGDEAGH